MDIPDFKKLKTKHVFSTTEMILNHLQEEGGVWTSVGIAECIGKTPKRVSDCLKQLVQAGKVRQVGKKANAPLYEIN